MIVKVLSIGLLAIPEFTTSTQAHKQAAQQLETLANKVHTSNKRVYNEFHRSVKHGTIAYKYVKFICI